MKKNVFIHIVLLLLISQAHFSQVPNEPLPPSWINKRPLINSRFVGIGFCDKSSGNNYQNEAKKNALFDLASEIKVDISSNSILYTVQNNNQFNENFNSLIKLSSNDNLEGYKLVDTYDNGKQYWVYYELDKQEYGNRKATKKQLNIEKAINLIALSFNDEKEGNFTGSLKKRIQSFGILSPYLNEELKFEAANNVRNIFDLSNLIQKQLQSISLVAKTKNAIIKPYQPSYKPLSYQLLLNNKTPLIDFPFIINSDNEDVKIKESTLSNAQGDIEIAVDYVKPLNQTVYFILNPDIYKLMNSDSVSKNAITILKKFIETPQLKAFAEVSSVKVFINCVEKNLNKLNNQKIVAPLISSRFNGNEVKLVETKAQADFLIDIDVNTMKDISSDVLNANYGVQLSFLKIKLSLRNLSTNELIYDSEISDIYAYGNSIETAGLNAYQSDKLKTKLNEGLFFLKRKLIVY